MEVHLDREIKTTYSQQASKILGKPYWYLNDAVKVSIRNPEYHFEFEIPQGYLTDGATVPRFLWAFFPLWDECTMPVVIHDYLCNERLITINGQLRYIDRLMADNLFLAAMEFQGVSKIKRFIMYNSVRLHSRMFNYKVPFYPEKKKEMERLIRINIAEGYYK